MNDVETALARAAIDADPILEVRLLGMFEVSSLDQTMTGFRYAKVRALLAALALAGGPLPRSKLAGLLWPDHPETRARASLSQALTTLRRALGPAHRDVIGADAARIWVASHKIEVDALVVGGLLDAADRHAHPSGRTCRHCDAQRADAVALARGELLADVVTGSDLFDDWAEQQRRLLHGRLTTALVMMIERARGAGRLDRAVALGRRLVELDPLVEAHRRDLVADLTTAGRLPEARAQLGELEQMVREQLGAEPEPATKDVAARLATAPAMPITLEHRGRLPMPTNPLVGRADELTAIAAALVDPAPGVLTLTGPGGVGKTCLALAAARAVADHFDDGVVFVDLSAVSDPASVPSAIAAAAGIDERRHRDTTAAVITELSHRHALLVLDNVEQVLEAAPVVGRLAAAGVTVLATSRRPLDLRAERNLVVEPLRPHHAAALLAARVTDVKGRTRSGTSTRAEAAEICRRVDHLPLAIELVAGRSRGRSLRSLLEELADPMTALTSTGRDVPARQRTMRATIEWGTDLLEADTRRLFHRLGVFAGGWTRDGARAVAGDVDGVDRRLDELVAASLVRVDGDDRFSMLTTFREYARDQLGDDAAAASTRDRHAAHLADLATEAEAGLLRPDAAAWVTRLEAEQDNLRVGFAWALTRGDLGTATRIAAGPWRYAWMRGLVREPLDRLLTVLSQPGELAVAWQTRARRAAGLLALAVGDLATALSQVSRAVDLARHAGDEFLLQLSLANLGLVRAESGDLDAAIEPLTESIELARALEGHRAKFPLGILAGVHVRRGEGLIAGELAAEGLRLNREAADPEGTADALRTLAAAVRLTGHRECAHRLVRDALARHGALGHELGTGLDLVVLGDLATDDGDRIGASRHYRAALGHWRRVANPIEIARVLERLARVLLDDGPAVSAQLLGAAGAIRLRTGAVPAPTEAAGRAELERALVIRLGTEAAIAETWCGGALTVGEALALAR